MSTNLKTVDCLICHEPIEVDAEVHTGVCGSCTTRAVGSPEPAVIRKEPKLTKSGKPRAPRGEGKKYVSSGFPRGWHFKKKYVHTDGKVYSKGKLITDANEIAKLSE